MPTVGNAEIPPMEETWRGTLPKSREEPLLLYSGAALAPGGISSSNTFLSLGDLCRGLPREQLRIQAMQAGRCSG